MILRTVLSYKVINKIMGNIPSYLHFTQCIRKRKTLYSQQLIDTDSDSDFDDDEKIIFYNRKDDSLKKKNYHTRRAQLRCMRQYRTHP